MAKKSYKSYRASMKASSIQISALDKQSTEGEKNLSINESIESVDLKDIEVIGERPNNEPIKI